MTRRNDNADYKATPSEPLARRDSRYPKNASNNSARSFLYYRLWRPFRDSISDTFSKQDYPLGYSPGLDGLRGFMTIGIIAAHIYLPIIPGAILYMDIFYVMSGYFITGLLIRDVKRHGKVRFVEFYRRRFLRIVPPFAAMVATFLLFGFLFLPNFKALILDAALGFFYVANWWRAFQWPGVNYMGHTWSLAVEEQFYLLWPLTFLLLVRLFGIGWRLVGAILTLALVVWLWRFWLTWNGTVRFRLYNGFDTHADSLMIGCALAAVLAIVSLDNRPAIDRVLKRLAWPVVACGLVFSFFFIHVEGRFYYYAGSLLLGAGLGVALMMILMRPLDTVLHRVFERRELVFIGHIFYAMYLWHFPIIIIMKNFGYPIWLQVVGGYALTFFIATLSYAFIERHFMRTKAAAPVATVNLIPVDKTVQAPS